MELLRYICVIPIPNTTTTCSCIMQSTGGLHNGSPKPGRPMCFAGACKPFYLDVHSENLFIPTFNDLQLETGFNRFYYILNKH
jgi:hypothetical protein